jgi:hypothetical protein
MKHFLKSVESLLRGEVHAKSLDAESPTSGKGPALLTIILAAGALFGLCMSIFGVLRGEDYGLVHILGVMFKVPLLFLLTLCVTAPSLYVFAALSQAELPFRQALRLMLAGAALSLVTLASFGPITVFFSFSTKSHEFMQLLSVALFAVAGLIGARYLGRNLSPEEFDERGRSTRKGVAVLRLWTVIYATVGLQMSWLLRPFIGDPDLPSTLFCETESNVLHGIFEALGNL